MRITLIITLVALLNFDFMDASEINEIQECIYEVKLQHEGDLSEIELNEMIEECKRGGE